MTDASGIQQSKKNNLHTYKPFIELFEEVTSRKRLGRRSTYAHVHRYNSNVFAYP